MFKNILYGLGILRGLTWLVGQFSSGITFESLPIQKADINIIQESLKLRFQVTNNNELPLPIEAINGTLQQGTRQLGTLNSLTLIQIAPKSSKTVIFDFKMNLEEILFQLAEKLEKGGLLTPVVFDGYVVIRGQQIPIKKTFNFLK